LEAQALTSGARGHCSAMLVGQLAESCVHIKAAESRQIRAEHAFLDSRHLEGVDRRVIVEVAGHVDGQQAVVWHRRQLSSAELRHLGSVSVTEPGHSLDRDH